MKYSNDPTLPEGSALISVIFSIVKLLSTLPVIFVEDNINELPVSIKKLTFVVDEEICNFTGTLPIFVIFIYLIVPVANVPAAGLAWNLAFPVFEPEGRFMLLLSA